MAGRLQRLKKWATALQGNSAIQIIVIHDQQDELTGQELVDILSTLQGIVSIEGHYGNPGAARNAGLQRANGKWICFWDSDDEPNVDHYIEMISVGDELDADICIGEYMKVNEKQIAPPIHRNWSKNEATNDLIFSMNPGIWRMCFQSKVIEQQQFQTHRMAEDQIFAAQAFSKARNIHYFNKSVYTYFAGSNLHLTSNREALSDLRQSFSFTLNLLENSSKKRARDVIAIMALRQFITGLRKANFLSKIHLIQLFLSWTARSSHQNRFALIQSLVKIVQGRKTPDER
jgi:glycosyltransferase involved in cell wall biosynthesis